MESGDDKDLDAIDVAVETNTTISEPNEVQNVVQSSVAEPDQRTSTDISISVENDFSESFGENNEEDQYWNVSIDSDEGLGTYSDISTDYDIDIYWVTRPVKLRNRNKQLKRIRRRLFDDYRKALLFQKTAEQTGLGGTDVQNFPAFLYKEKWGLIRSYIPPADGSSPISKLPSEILQNIFHKLFYLRFLENYRKMEVAKVACVNKQFNSHLQPILFNVLNIPNLESLHQLAAMLLQSPYLCPLIECLHLKLSSTTSIEAALIAKTLIRITSNCPNLRTITANFSGGHGRELVLPVLDPKKYGSVAPSVLNLNFLFESYSVPFTLFAQGFENLKVLQFGHIDMNRLTITKADLQIKLPTVFGLQLMAPILSNSAIKLITSALPNIQLLDATAVPCGMIELLSEIVATTDTLSAVRLIRCNGPIVKSLLSGSVWKTLESVELVKCSMMSSAIFPTHERYNLSSLPKLSTLSVAADIKLPISHADFTDLMNKVNMLPDLLGATEPSDSEFESGVANGKRKDVTIKVSCDNCAFYDTYGTTSYLSTAQQPRSPMADQFRGKTYKLLDTVGEPGARKIVRMDTETLERFKMDLGVFESTETTPTPWI
ncbi:hypothetical protein V1512DRAFT_259541 [Lipomyces arxii]|uniref:uncharacterized protein n=1 Tax=Lipomyces arxii TaxID=56418 RepID=UPI0034CF12A2